jgi:structure-specific endonuclease subunit SLX1
VYLLESTKNATYVGATIDVNRRLRQHNKEIKGGARATGSRVSKGETWRRICYVSGFPDWTSALQFEWRWKKISRVVSKKMKFKNPLHKRIYALDTLLGLNQSTTKAIPFTEWEVPPHIHWENPDSDFVSFFCNCIIL